MAKKKRSTAPADRCGRADAAGRMKDKRHGTRSFISWVPEAELAREPHYNPVRKRGK